MSPEVNQLPVNPTNSLEGNYDYAQAFIVSADKYYKVMSPNTVRDQGILAIQGNNIVFASVNGEGFKEAIPSPKYTLTPSGLLKIILPNGKVWFFGPFVVTSIMDQRLGPLAANFHIPESVTAANTLLMDKAQNDGADAFQLSASRTPNLIKGFQDSEKGMVESGNAIKELIEEANNFASQLSARGATVEIKKMSLGYKILTIFSKK